MVEKKNDPEPRNLGEVEIKYNIVPTDKITPGPIRHEKLRDDQLALIKFIWRRLGPHWIWKTYEELVDGFRRDVHPDREILVWTAVTRAFLDFTKRHQKADKKEVIADLVSLTCGAPIFRRHSDQLEQLLVGHYANEKKRFCQKFGQKARELLADYI